MVRIMVFCFVWLIFPFIYILRVNFLMFRFYDLLFWFHCLLYFPFIYIFRINFLILWFCGLLFWFHGLLYYPFIYIFRVNFLMFWFCDLLFWFHGLLYLPFIYIFISNFLFNFDRLLYRPTFLKVFPIISYYILIFIEHLLFIIIQVFMFVCWIYFHFLDHLNKIMNR